MKYADVLNKTAFVPGKTGEHRRYIKGAEVAARHLHFTSMKAGEYPKHQAFADELTKFAEQYTEMSHRFMRFMGRFTRSDRHGVTAYPKNWPDFWDDESRADEARHWMWKNATY